MDKKKIGLNALMEVIGMDFCNAHEDTFCFSWGEEEKGLYCFLGYSLQSKDRIPTLSQSIDDWDVYATCYVTDDNEVIMDKCKLP